MAPVVANTTRDTLRRQAVHLSSAAWLYPIKGVYYFFTHPFLYPCLRRRLLPCFLLSALVLTTLFLWTYLPQVAFLALFQGKGAWLNTTFLVLGEGAAITSLMFEAFFVDAAQVDIFDAVLVNEGFQDLVKVRRPVRPTAEGLDALKRLEKPTEKSGYSPFSFLQILEFVILLPLNLIPWVGVPLFLWLTGYRAGPLQQWRYFKLRGFNKQERNQFIKARRLGYTSFGSMALVLQLVPVLSMFFLLTTAAGSALWAAKIEQLRLPTTAAAASTEPPPEYTEYADDPI